MINKLITLLLLVTFYLPGVAQKPDVATVSTWNNVGNTGFLENKGQVTNLSDGTPNTDVRFMMEHGDTKFFLMNGGLAWQFNKLHYTEDFLELIGDPSAAKQQQARNMEKDIRLETWRMDMTLVGANKNAKVITEGRSSDFVNYYNHNALDVHSYSKVTYQDIYEGIDWVIYLSGEQMKYDFIVHPGADASQIVIRYSDYETLQLNEDGSCSLGNKMGTITENAPVSFQDGNTIATQFVLEGNTLRFELGAYNKNKTLVIDPIVREWGTYYGGPNYDAGNSCATDLSGNVFLAGTTTSFVGIAAGGYQNGIGGGYDAMLVKFTAAGARLWATYYGGGANESGDYCVTDASGNVYMSGYTGSGTSIAAGGHQNTIAGALDLYLVKFDPSGTRLWATYYGGASGEYQTFCAMDASGNVYLSGQTTGSTTGIASGGHQNTFGGGSMDAFLVKFNTAGVRLWGTYYGGTGDDYGYTCATDASGNVYLTGETYSSNAIASGGHQNTFGGVSDAFLVKFNSGGVRQWATYYGGANEEMAWFCQIDGSGNIYLGGATGSNNAISSGGHQNSFGGNYDGFLVKFNAAGVRQWGTYYGDSGNDFIFSGGIDADGNIYIAGSTASATAISSGGYQNTFAGFIDGFFVKFNPSGVRQWGTYYGGTSLDEIYDFTINAAGVIYFCGYTGSTTGIAGGGFLNTTLGSDVFLVKFTPPPGAALSFDGSNDIVSIPANPAFDFTTGTVECWFNSASASGNNCLLGMRTTTTGARWSIHMNENTNQVGIFNGAAFLSLSATINPNTWYHLAVVMNLTSSTFYLNGTNIGTIALGMQTSATGLPLTIGGHTDPAWPEFFNGSIDEVRIWNRALCSSEITSCMSGETPAFTNGLLVDYHFNQGYESGINTGITTLIDASGNNRNGTLQSFALSGTTSNWIAPGGITSGSNATPVITATVSSTNVSCNGGSNGSATITATGSGPFTYSWAPTGGSAATATGLTPGSYSCTISNGCVSSIATVTITQPAVISLSAVVTHISCSSTQDGAINLTVTGGTGPFTYSWSFGFTTEDISGLTPGTYLVIVTDANGCTATSSIYSVSYSSTLSSSVIVGTIPCNGGTTTATITAISGTAPYTYSWSPSGGNAATSTPIGPGEYYCFVTDANGCNTSQSFILTEPAVLSASATVTSNYNGYPISCFGNADGQITAIVSGGTAPYSYTWSNAMITQTINGVSAGVYTYTVTDVSGCSATASVTLTQPAPLVANTTSTGATCHGSSSGAVDLSVTGGTGSYSYSWSNSETTEDINGLEAGTYNVAITDVNGCINTTSITVTEPTFFIPLSSSTSILCNGGTATVTVTGSGGTSPYTGEGSFTVTAGYYYYLVTDANGCVSATSITVTEPILFTSASGATSIACNGGNATVTVMGYGGTPPYTGEGSFAEIAGTYSYTVTDDNGCTNTTSIIVTEPTVLSASSSATSILCNGGNAIVTVTGSGGTSSYTGEGPFTETAGTYSYTVTDANGCTSTTSVTVTEPTILSASVNATSNPTICGGTNGSIDISVTGGTTSYSFLWNNSVVTEDLTAIGAGSYSVICTDSNGCTTTVAASINDPNAPTVTLALQMDTACGDFPGIINLSGGLPAGGIFSGTAVSGNTFDPFTAGMGLHYITYTFTDVNGCTGSTIDSIFVNNCMGIQTIATTEWNLFPNPTNGAINITTTADLNGDVIVEIYSVDGKLIRNENESQSKNITVDMTTEPVGVYFIRITANDKVSMHRVVKI